MVASTLGAEANLAAKDDQDDGFLVNVKRIARESAKVVAESGIERAASRSATVTEARLRKIRAAARKWSEAAKGESKASADKACRKLLTRGS
jgi:hypothetical protein